MVFGLQNCGVKLYGFTIVNFKPTKKRRNCNLVTPLKKNLVITSHVNKNCEVVSDLAWRSTSFLHIIIINLALF